MRLFRKSTTLGVMDGDDLDRITAGLDAMSRRHAARRSGSVVVLERRDDPSDRLALIHKSDGWLIGSLHLTSDDALAFVRLYLSA